jgi:hypothetical protein
MPILNKRVAIYFNSMKRRENMFFFKLLLLASLVIVNVSFAGSPLIKVDFDVSGRTSNEVSEANYIPWVVTGVASKDTTISGVKIKVEKGSVGTAIKTNWYKGIVQAPYYAKLVGDGILVENGNAGGELSLSFSGLSAGTHSLLTYLNNVDAPTAYTYSKIDVYVNGVKTLSNLVPSNRAVTKAEATTAYVTFNVSAGATATIRFVPSSSATFKNVTINGFELNVENSLKQAQNPSPLDLEDHAEAVSNALTLSWSAAAGANKHRVYVGVDSTSVVNATTSSTEYKGEQTGTTYKVDGLYGLNSYYWRIDEVDGSGVVTRGNVWKFRLARLAFEGAEGYGRMARGGRGGKVVYVTNLNDSGAGSLRAAVENDIGPRTIVFKVAGVITLKSRLTLSSSYVTVAGQTAPGKGITIRSAPFGNGGNDNIFRFIRLRLGAGPTFDGMGMAGSKFSIFDHCSISWTIDEAFSSRNAKNMTLQRTLISEALNIAGHQNYPAGTGHGYAATISGDIGSFHHNLLAHNAGRNWSLGGGLDADGNYAGRLDIFNNVVYNWLNRATDGGAHEVNFTNNYYKEGPATTLHLMLSADLEGAGGGSQSYYYSGNVLQSASGSFTCDGSNNECGRRYTLSNGQVLNWDVFVTKPFFPSYATVQTAKAAYKDVLSDVGASMPFFDNHDTRIIEETKKGSYTYTGSVGKLKGIIDKESDVGGFESYPSTSWADDYDTDLDGLPDWWEVMYGYNPKSAAGDFSDANADRKQDGYTELERFLEWMARPNYKIEDGETQVVDLSTFTKGYGSGTYVLTDIPSGVVASVSGSKMSVSLSASFGGVAYITYKFTDSVGDTFTRKIGVRGNAPATQEAAAIAKCGAGSSKQSVVQGDSIVGFCYTWTGATTVAVSGFPSSLDINIDESAKKVTISGRVTDAAGEYAFSVNTVGAATNATKTGLITVTDMTSLDQKNINPKINTIVKDGYVYLRGVPSDVQITVTDISGKHLMVQKTLRNFNSEVALDLRNISNGFYIIQVKGKNLQKRIKISKK